MRVAAAMILLLCCGVVASAAAVNDDVALAEHHDAAVKGGLVDIGALLSLLRLLYSQKLTNERVTQLEAQRAADAQKLQDLTRQLEQTSQDGAGASTFVRWGSSTCGAGNASSLVYSGVVGGGHYTHTGAAVNYLCLSLSPRLGQRTLPTANAILCGAEYETFDSDHNKEPVCAVCRAAFSTTVMIPGTDTCTPGWRLQYSGYLMAGHHSQPAATEFICVDPALESAPLKSGPNAANQNGKLLYFTKTQCGSLPCGPYVNGKFVTCAVCSK